MEPAVFYGEDGALSYLEVNRIHNQQTGGYTETASIQPTDIYCSPGRTIDVNDPRNQRDENESTILSTIQWQEYVRQASRSVPKDSPEKLEPYCLDAIVKEQKNGGKTNEL